MKERLKTEPVERGVERTIMFLENWAKENNTVYNRYFNDVKSQFSSILFVVERYLWVLSNSTEAQGLIDRLNSEQLKMITDYLEIDYWQRTMSVNPQDTRWVEGILGEAGI